MVQMNVLNHAHLLIIKITKKEHVINVSSLVKNVLKILIIVLIAKVLINSLKIHAFQIALNIQLKEKEYVIIVLTNIV